MMTTLDGLKLYVKEWPVENPKAAVVLVHGYGEHIGRYGYVAAALNRAGYTVIGADHRLHGRSEGSPRAYVTEIDQLVDDLKLVWDTVKAKHPDKPTFMLGHSMGGLVAACFALRHQDEMHGLVTSGAALLSRESFSLILISAVQLMAKIAPQIPSVRVNSSSLSHDSQIAASYDSDPLNHRRAMKAATLWACVKAGDDAIQRAHTLKIPLLMLHGEKDRVVPNKATQTFFKRAGAQDKTLKIYPGLFHEIFNEPEKDEILQTVVIWLDAHLFASNEK